MLPGELDARQLGRLLGCSDRTVRDLRERGVIAAGSRPGRFPAAAAVRAIVAHFREVAAGRAADAGGLDLLAERARLAAAQADRVELELRERRGELVNAAEVRTGFIGLVTTARNRLRGVPSKAKGHMPHLSVGDIETLGACAAEPRRRSDE